MFKSYQRFLGLMILAFGLVASGSIACGSKNPCSGVDAGGGDVPAECLCGNGKVDPGEQCDDGNDNDDKDSCSNSCKSNLYQELCGNGVLGKIKFGEEGKEPTILEEECDDGNNTNGDGCNAWCFIEDYDTHGAVAPEDEFDFSNNPETRPFAVSEETQEPSCGDGNVDFELGETCDDGNRESGDGCSNHCEREHRFEQVGEQDPARP